VERDSLAPTKPPEAPGRWELLRDVLVFQLKLLLDAFRDVVMSPISLVAGAIDILSGDEPTGRAFYRVLAFGRRTDTWINLFGTPAAPHHAGGDEEVTVDSLVSHMERLVVAEYERGGVTASTKQAIDRSLDVISRRHRRKPPPRGAREGDDDA